MSDADDVIGKAGRFFSKLGGTIKQTSKQVTGLGRGTVRLELDRTRLAPGDALRGRVVLALDEPIDAKRLVVTLAAHQRTVEIKRDRGNRVPVSSRTQIYHLDRELSGPTAYASSTVAFELDVPPDALDLHAAAGSHPIADVVREVASVFSPTAGPIEWSVTARLDISWGRDLSHKVDVVISR
jgi:hypothetical protein